MVFVVVVVALRLILPAKTGIGMERIAGQLENDKISPHYVNTCWEKLNS